MKSILRVMPRDIEALSLLYQFHFATIDDMKLAIYKNWNVAQRRLQGLAKLGLIRELGITLENRGRPTKVFFLNRAKRGQLSKTLNQELSIRNLESASGLQDQNLRHHLGINSLLCRLIGNCTNQKVQVRFIGEYHRTETGEMNRHAIEDEVRDPLAKGKQVRYRRDAIIKLSTQRGSALFELEYDRGTEVLKSPSRRTVTLHRKVAIFLQSIKEKRFQRYCRPEFFNSRFNVSRLLLVTTTEARLRNFIDSISDLNTQGIVLATSEERLSQQSLLSKAWFAMNQSGQAEQRSLLGES